MSITHPLHVANRRTQLGVVDNLPIANPLRLLITLCVCVTKVDPLIPKVHPSTLPDECIPNL